MFFCVFLLLLFFLVENQASNDIFLNPSLTPVLESSLDLDQYPCDYWTLPHTH